MNKPEAFLAASEHLFVLGCQLPHLERQIMSPEEARWRALYVFPFHPTFVIDIHVLSDMAELIFHSWDHANEENAKHWRWFHKVIDSFELDRSPSEPLPEGYQFSTSKTDLSPAQLQWFREHIATIPQPLLTSDDPKEAPERDGHFLRGSIKFGNGPVHMFNTWEGKENEANRYFLHVYQLACSALSQDKSKLLLVKMQRYFFGLKVMQMTEFVFPLID